jgi:hypothetical protein
MTKNDKLPFGGSFAEPLAWPTLPRREIRRRAGESSSRHTAFVSAGTSKAICVRRCL